MFRNKHAFQTDIAIAFVQWQSRVRVAGNSSSSALRSYTFLGLLEK
jgi:hypothetical protein